MAIVRVVPQVLTVGFWGELPTTLAVLYSWVIVVMLILMLIMLL